MAWYSGSKDSEVVAVWQKGKACCDCRDCGLYQDKKEVVVVVVVDDLYGDGAIYYSHPSGRIKVPGWLRGMWYVLLLYRRTCALCAFVLHRKLNRYMFRSTPTKTFYTLHLFIYLQPLHVKPALSHQSPISPPLSSFNFYFALQFIPQI
jgi:hypothetical protein